MNKDIDCILQTMTLVSASEIPGTYAFYSMVNRESVQHEWVVLSSGELHAIHPDFSEILRYCLNSGKHNHLADIRLTLDFLQNKLEFLKLPNNYYRTKPHGIKKSSRTKDCYFVICNQFNLVKSHSGIVLAQGTYHERYLQHRSWLESHYPGLAEVVDRIDALGVTDPLEIARLAFETVQTVCEPVDFASISFD